MKIMDRLNIVLMGATGFTGLNCIPHIYKLAKSDGRNYTWGVAGRSEEKLKQILKQMEEKIGVDFSNIPVIICNTQDDESLYNMAKQAKLVINCVGPYVLYGERVVDACLKAGTHHVDVSGEPNYMELMQLKKHKTAQEKGVYIVSACGMDSIPVDLGVVFLEQNFEGIVNSVVTYLEFSTGGKKGAAANIGTWASFVNSVPLYREQQRIRRQLFPEKLPTFRPKLKKRIFPHRVNFLNGWILPFPAADEAVASRTQRYFYELENKRPIQVDTLCVFKSFWYVFLLGLMSIPVLLLCLCQCGRNLLVKYPEKFSFGYFSNKPPSQEVIENSSFQLTLAGEGWSETNPGEGNQLSKPCNKKMMARVKGKNPIYGSTCVCLVGAAITILSERDKLSGNGKGGVYSPGATFAKTSLIKLLNDNGVTFEIVPITN